MENSISLPRTAGRIAAGGSLILGGAGAGMILAPSVGATPTTFHVTNLLDAGIGSLRDAVVAANANAGADTIVFDAGATGTITLTSGQIAITDDVTITGLGATNSTVSGNNASRIFYIGTGTNMVSASIESLTLTDGYAHTLNGDWGGAISGYGASLTLSNVVVSGNSASEGGGIFLQPYYSYYGAGGSLEINNSVISENSASTLSGGGIKVIGLDSVHVTGSVISDNSAQQNGGGGYLSSYSTVIESSTIADNSSGSDSGGGLWAGGYSFTMTNSTVSGNRGNDGSALRLYVTNQLIENSTIANNVRTGVTGDGAIIDSSSHGSMKLLFTTVSGNQTDGAATLSFSGASSYYSPAPVEIIGSVISDNTTASGSGVSETAVKARTVASVTVANSLVMGQWSLESPSTDGGGNITGVSAQLGALTDNGGPTQTMEPSAGSPVIDAGPLTWVPFTGDGFDQRGATFTRVVGSRSDMGAVENQTVQTTTTTQAPTTTTISLGSGETTTTTTSDPVAPAFTG